MNSIEAKKMFAEAENFKQEILAIMPDIPREKLSEMVGRYVFYYQETGAGSEDMDLKIEEQCARKWR